MGPFTAESVQKIFFIRDLLCFESPDLGFVTPGHRDEIKGIGGMSPEHPTCSLLGGNPLHIIPKAGDGDALHGQIGVLLANESATTDPLAAWADIPLDAHGLVVGIHPDGGGLGGLRRISDDLDLNGHSVLLNFHDPFAGCHGFSGLGDWGLMCPEE